MNPSGRHFAKAIGYFAALIGGVFGYMGIAYGLGAWLGAGATLGWIVGSLLLAGVFLVAAEEAAREQESDSSQL